MRRTHIVSLAIVVGGGILGANNPAALGDGPDAERPTTGTTVTGELPRHLRAIQRNLGGSVVEHFDQLQPTPTSAAPWWKQFEQAPQATATDSPHWPTPGGSTAATGVWPKWAATAAQPLSQATASAPLRSGSPSPTVAALRVTAAQLDEAANRLEELELYRQSDSLRDLAQRLRVDARRMMTGEASAYRAPQLLEPSATIEPAIPTAPRGVVPPGTTAPMPTLTPDPTPIPSFSEPQPATEAPAAAPTEILEPTPATETPAQATE